MSPWVASTRIEVNTSAGCCQVALSLVETLAVIETEIVSDPDPSISSTLICFHIYLLLLCCPPQRLYEQIIAIAPFPIHADPHSVLS